MVESWIWIVVYVISSQNWRGFFVASRIRSVLACVEVVTSKVMSKLMSHSGHVLGVGWQPPGQECHAPGPGPNSSYRQNGGEVCAVQHIVVESCQLCQGAILTLCRSVRRFINSEVFLPAEVNIGNLRRKYCVIYEQFLNSGIMAISVANFFILTGTWLLIMAWLTRAMVLSTQPSMSGVNWANSSL